MLLDRGSIVRLLLHEYPWASRPKIPCQVCCLYQLVNSKNFDIGAISKPLTLMESCGTGGSMCGAWSILAAHLS